MVPDNKENTVFNETKQKTPSLIFASLWIIGIECFILAFIAPHLIPGPKGMKVPMSDIQSTVMFSLLGISMAFLLFGFVFVIFLSKRNRNKPGLSSRSKNNNGNVSLKPSDLISKKRNFSLIIIAIAGIILLSGVAAVLAVSGNNYMNLQIHNLSSPDAQTVSDAANALSKIGDFRSSKPLVSILKDRSNDYNTRYFVLMALIKLGDKSVESDLIAALNDFGNKEIAETYLNSGNDRLKDAAITWGESNGLYLKTIIGGYSDTPKWGKY
jgi:hypothetical protein